MRKLIGPFLLRVVLFRDPAKIATAPRHTLASLVEGGAEQMRGGGSVNVRFPCVQQPLRQARSSPATSPYTGEAHRIGLQKKILQSKRFFGKRRRRRKWRGDDGRHPPHDAPCGDAVTPSGLLRSPAPSKRAQRVGKCALAGSSCACVTSLAFL